jgi:lipid II:glycine glycyltransferase (peptidoglycan interpeptide bridge formation enzyme)
MSNASGGGAGLEFCVLSEAEYQGFYDDKRQASFLQSIEMGKRRAVDGWTMHLLGVKRAGEIVAATVLFERPVFAGFRSFESQQGPIIDFSDHEVVDCFLDNIKRYVKGRNALELRINPDVVRMRYDEQRTELGGDASSELAVRSFADAGFKKIPDSVVDNDPVMMRWYFTKDISGIADDDELMESFDQQTRWSIRKSQKTGVVVRELSLDDLPIYEEIMAKTERRRGFRGRTHSFYVSMLEQFGPERLKFFLAELDVNAHKANLTSMLDEQMKHKSAQQRNFEKDPTDKKAKSAIKVADDLIATYTRQLEQAESYGDVVAIPLAGAMFLKNRDEMVYLLSGADTEYSRFNGPYAIQWHAMTLAIRGGMKRYNFYGTKGEHTGHPEQEGIFRFKRGFGGMLEEQVGFFVYQPRPLVSALRTVASSLKSRLR